MARIRADFDGLICGHPTDEFGHVLDEAVWLKAGDVVPANVRVSDAHLEPAGGESTDGPEPAPGGQGGEGSGKDIVAPLPVLPNVDELTVDEVNGWLEDRPADVVRAVLEAEAAGRNRAGIVNGPAARHLQHGGE